MPNLRAKPEDKFSKARSAKNSPERQAAAEKKRTTPRGPSSVKPKSAKERDDKESQQPDLSKKQLVARRDAAPKMRDEERVYNLVHAILSAWKADIGHAEHTAASSGIIKVSRRKIEGALRDLKNTRFTKIPTLINDVLVYNEVCNEFGQWVYVEHDSPDWIFVKLPENSTPVLRADISYDRTGQTSTAILTSSEPLLESFDEEEEDEIPENVEYDDYEDWTLSQLQKLAVAENYIGVKDAGYRDRATLISRIRNKGAIE